MKNVILILAFAAVSSGSAPRDKRSYAHSHAHAQAHAQAYPEYPVSVHTVVQPSSTLPVYEYPESTEINTHSRTVYSVSVPITHTVHLEQPSYSRQVKYYHQPPTYNYQNYHQSYYTPVQQSYYTPVQKSYYTPVQQSYYTPVQQSYYTPVQKSYYTPVQQSHHTPVYTTHRAYAPSHPWVYQRNSAWC